MKIMNAYRTPWTVGTDNPSRCTLAILDADGEVVAEVPRFDGTRAGDDENLPHLIAAAPELLAALTAYVKEDDVGQRLLSPCYVQARAAIAKAKGDSTWEEI